MTRIITCSSGKGGVGKTTTVANLGAALAEMGYDVVVLDANLTTPNLGMHLGIPLFPVTLHDVLKGKARLEDAIYRHSSGLKIIPAGIGVNDLKGVDARDLPAVLLDLVGSADIVLIDSAAGLGREALAAIESSDEMLVVTNPDLPSVTDALKAVKIAEGLGTKITGVVVNRIDKKRTQLSREEIMTMLDDVPILAEIPESDLVAEAIANRNPVVHHKPYSDVSIHMKRLAATLVGKPVESINKPFMQRLMDFFLLD